MTETTSTEAVPARTLDTGRHSPGEYLRKLREEKGLTHAAVGSALHLTVHYIKALESDEYGKLPGLTFVKGYLRSYARFLGADVDNVIGRFDEHITGLLDAGMHTARVERSKRRQDQALRWAFGAGFVVVAGLAAGWWFVSGQGSAPEAAQLDTAPAVQDTASAPPPVMAAAVPARRAPATTFTNTITPATAAVSPTTAPVSPATGAVTAASSQATVQAASTPGVTAITETHAGTMTGAAASTVVPPAASATSNIISAPVVTALASGSRNVSLVAAGDDELRVTFNGNSWIEVDDASMVRLYNDMLRTGDTLTIRGVAPFHVLLGDASGVAVAVNAVAIDISSDVRDDSTARLVLGAPAGAMLPAATETPGPEQAPAAAPAQEVQ